MNAIADRTIAQIKPEPFGVKPMPRFRIPTSEQIQDSILPPLSPNASAPSGTALVPYKQRETCERCPFGSCAGDCMRKGVEKEDKAFSLSEETMSGRIRAAWEQLLWPITRAWRWFIFAE